jgi:hypothetical protein
MGVCHLCLRTAETEPADFLPALTHGRGWPRPVAFASYARALEPAAQADSAVRLCAHCRARQAAGEARLRRRALRPALFGWDVLPVVRFGSWLPRLIAAAAWRVLERRSAEDAAPSSLAPDLRQASETWRAFAAGERSSVGRFLLHLLPVVPLVDEWRQAAYAQRAGAMQAVVARTGDAFVWMKLPGLLALGSVRAPILSGRPLDERAGTWTSQPGRVPGLIQFLMFEELQRSLSRCHPSCQMPLQAEPS